MVYIFQKNYTQAENAFQKAVDIRSQWPVPNNNLARLYLIQGKKQEAVAKFESSLRNNPRNPAAYLSLGYIYQQSGEVQKAIETYEKALENNPNLWVAANNLAVLLSEKKYANEDLKKAFELAKRAHALRSDEPSVQDTLGWVYYKMDEMNQSLALLEEALAGEPENPIFNYHAGMALYKSKRPDDAREKLSRALESREDFEGRAEAEEILRSLN